MPKDAKKNVDRYKLAGGHLNEFEFHQNQGQVKESSQARKSAGTAGTTKKVAAKKSGKKAGKK